MVNQRPRTAYALAVRTIFDDADDERGYRTKWDRDVSGFLNHDISLYNVDLFPHYTVTVDMSKPETAADTITLIVDEIGKQCPTAKYFGTEGTGEGLVFACGDELFKVVSKEHKVTKTKVTVPLDMTMVNSVKEFITNTVTENRLNQGVRYLTEIGIATPTMKEMGIFLKWLYGDIIKEESDTIAANLLDQDMIGKEVATIGRIWYSTNFR